MSLLRSYLEANALLTAADLEVAVRHQQSQGGSLDTALLELGLLTAAELDLHLGRACGLPTVPARLLETGAVRPWQLVPKALVDIGWAMPLAIEDGNVLVAVHPDLPDARLGALYRQIRGFMPMVAPECCLAKLAAERSGGIVAPRHAMLVLDVLDALQARDAPNQPQDTLTGIAVPPIAGHPAQPATSSSSSPSSSPSPSSPSSSSSARPTPPSAWVAPPAPRDLFVVSVATAVLPVSEAADSISATIVGPVPPPDAADSLTATIVGRVPDPGDSVSAGAIRRGLASDDPGSSGTFPVAGSGSFPAADSGTFPAASSGVFPDLRSVGAQAPRSARPPAAAHASSRAPTPVPQDRTAPVPQDRSTAPVPQDSRTTVRPGPAASSPAASPVLTDSRPSPPSDATPGAPTHDVPATTSPGDARPTAPFRAAALTSPPGSASRRVALPADSPYIPAPAVTETGAPDPGASLSAPILHDPTRAERLAFRMAPARAALAQARERDRITAAIVQGAVQISPRVALFGVKREGLRALATPGSDLQLPPTVVIPIPEGSLLDRAVLGQVRLKLLTEPRLATAVGRPLGIPCLFEPVYAQDRCVLMLYIDRDGGLFDAADHTAARDLCDLARGSLEALLRLMGAAASRSSGVIVDSSLTHVQPSGPLTAAEASATPGAYQAAGTGDPTREPTAAPEAGPRDSQPQADPEHSTPTEAGPRDSRPHAAADPEPTSTEPTPASDDVPGNRDTDPTRPLPLALDGPTRARPLRKRHVIALVNPIRRDTEPTPDPRARRPQPDIVISERPALSSWLAVPTHDLEAADDAAHPEPVPQDSSAAPPDKAVTAGDSTPVPEDSSEPAPSPADDRLITATGAPPPAEDSSTVLHVPNLVAPTAVRRAPGKKGERVRSAEAGLVMPDLRRPGSPSPASASSTTLSIPVSLIAPTPLPGARRRGSKTGQNPVVPGADEITLNMPRLVRNESGTSTTVTNPGAADLSVQTGEAATADSAVTVTDAEATGLPAATEHAGPTEQITSTAGDPTAVTVTDSDASGLSSGTGEAAPAESMTTLAVDLDALGVSAGSAATTGTTVTIDADTREPATAAELAPAQPAPSDLSDRPAEPAAPQPALETTPPAPPAPVAPVAPVSSVAPVASAQPRPSERTTEPVAAASAIDPAEPPAVEPDAAIEAYLHDSTAADAIAKLRAAGPAVLPRIAARFPGPNDLGAQSDVRSFPPPSAHGPLLRACIELGTTLTPHILDLVDHPRPQIRFYAAFLFQELRDARSLRPLAAHAFDPDPDVRLIATRVLESYSRAPGFVAATEVVRAELKSRDRERVLLATEAAGTLRDTHAVPTLIDLLSTRDKQVRETALESLCSITAKHHGYRPAKWKSWYAEHGQQTRIEWVIDALRHRDTAVRRWAADELVRITGHRIAAPPDGEKPNAKFVLAQWQAWFDSHGAEYS